MYNGIPQDFLAIIGDIFGYTVYRRKALRASD